MVWQEKTFRCQFSNYGCWGKTRSRLPVASARSQERLVAKQITRVNVTVNCRSGGFILKLERPTVGVGKVGERKQDKQNYTSIFSFMAWQNTRVVEAEAKLEPNFWLINSQRIDLLFSACGNLDIVDCMNQPGLVLDSKSKKRNLKELEDSLRVGRRGFGKSYSIYVTMSFPRNWDGLSVTHKTLRIPVLFAWARPPSKLTSHL